MLELHWPLTQGRGGASLGSHRRCPRRRRNGRRSRGRHIARAGERLVFLLFACFQDDVLQPEAQAAAFDGYIAPSRGSAWSIALRRVLAPLAADPRGSAKAEFEAQGCSRCAGHMRDCRASDALSTGVTRAPSRKGTRQSGAQANDRQFDRRATRLPVCAEHPQQDQTPALSRLALRRVRRAALRHSGRAQSCSRRRRLLQDDV
mmetsp:Transcript_44689/g.104376  ORF Transcript_44689/g.104376 Transcript_44689/m.104376 type:complete len:204 (-) Transcript_44689:136-747(-)